MDPDIGFFKWVALKAGTWLQRLGGRLERWADPSVRLRVLLEEQRAAQRPSALGDYISTYYIFSRFFLNFCRVLDWPFFVLSLQRLRYYVRNAWTTRTTGLWRNLSLQRSRGMDMPRDKLSLAPGSVRMSRWWKHVVYSVEPCCLFSSLLTLMYLCSQGSWPLWLGCGPRVRPTTTSLTFLQGEVAARWTPWLSPWPPQTHQLVSQNENLLFVWII